MFFFTQANHLPAHVKQVRRKDKFSRAIVSYTGILHLTIICCCYAHESGISRVRYRNVALNLITANTFKCETVGHT